MVELLEFVKQWININNEAFYTEELKSSAILPYLKEHSRDLAFKGEYLENKNRLFYPLWLWYQR